MLVAIAGVLAIKIWGYKGFLVVEGVEPPYVVDLKGYGRLDCLTDPCRLSVPPDDFLVVLKKDGFFEVSAEQSIPLRGTITWMPVLQKVPVLAPLTEKSAFFVEKFYAAPPVGEGNPFAFRAGDDQLFFLNLLDGGLFSGVGKERILLARFSDLRQATLFPGQKAVFVLSEGRLFEVLINQKRKLQLLIDEKIQTVGIDERDNLFVRTERDLMVRLADEEQFFSLPPALATTVDLACALDRTVFFATALDFYRLALGANEAPQKISAFAAESPPQKIACESANSLVLLLANGEEYRLDF